MYPITRTGLRSVDSANAVYSVSSIEVHCCISGVYLIERFARPVNVRILAEQYLGVPDVESPSAGSYSGALSRITLVRQGTLLDFVFDRRGPACGAEESSHRYFVTYDRRDGQVTWHGEQCIPGFDYGG